MFWVEEDNGKSETDDRNVTKKTEKQVESGERIKTSEVSAGRTERLSLVPLWSLVKWLRHFVPVSSQNSPKQNAVRTRRIEPIVRAGNRPVTSANNWRQKNSNKIPFGSKIRERHLQLEPLCCLSSCLIRGGSMAVAIFEYIYVLITVTAIILRLYSDGTLLLWPPLEMSYNSVVTHTVLLYVILFYDLVIMIMATGLIRALVTFDCRMIQLHLYFDYLALIFNVIILVLFFPVFSTNSVTHNFSNVVLTLCFTTQIPLQIWSITVLRSCLAFFILVHVLVNLAEK